MPNWIVPPVTRAQDRADLSNIETHKGSYVMMPLLVVVERELCVAQNIPLFCGVDVVLMIELVRVWDP